MALPGTALSEIERGECTSLHAQHKQGRHCTALQVQQALQAEGSRLQHTVAATGTLIASTGRRPSQRPAGLEVQLLQELQDMSAKLASGIRDDALSIGSVIGIGAYSTVYGGVWQGGKLGLKAARLQVQGEQRLFLMCTFTPARCGATPRTLKDASYPKVCSRSCAHIAHNTKTLPLCQSISQSQFILTYIRCVVSYPCRPRRRSEIAGFLRPEAAHGS